MSDAAAAFRARLASRELVVGVVGLGYVGLPLAVAFAEGGFPVIGFDVDPAKVAALAAGRPYVGLDPARFAAVAARFEATSDFDRLAEPDAILVCVPTPVDAARDPDLRYVDATTEAIARRLRRGQLVVLESTTYPGTTDERVAPRLREQGFELGREVFLAYSPEREDPGNRRFGTTVIPKVVGGVDALSGDLAEALYAAVFAKTVRVGSARAAEAAKLTENVFRAVNIALVNELKLIYEGLGIDVWEVLDAAATKPFGFMRFDPGPGWGGHCIPVDPFYLAWKARGHGLQARFIELAGAVNVEMPRHVVARLEGALDARGRALRGARIFLLGLAYKPDVGDPRESPAFEILEQLLERGAEVAYHDPHVPVAPAMRTWPELPPLRSQPLDEATLAGQDAVVLVTHHSAVDYDRVLRLARLIVDTRGVYREARANVVKA